MRVLFLVFSVVLVACSDSGKNATPNNVNNINNMSDSGADADQPDARVVDSGTDMGTGGDMSVFLPSCNGAVALDTTIEVDSTGLGGQLYARAAWDGSGAWVTWAAPAVDSGPEAVFAARVDCKGAIDVGPLQLSPDGDTARHLQPVISTSEGSTFIVWFSQTDTGDTSLWTRVFNQTGAEQTSTPMDVTPQTQGAPASMLIWNPDVAAIDESNAAITFAYADAGFKVGVQRISSTGVRNNDFFVPVDDQNAEQTMPSIGALDDGTLVLSWIRVSDASDDQALVTHIPPGSMMANPASGIPAKPLVTPNPLARVSNQTSVGGKSFMAFQVTSAQRSDILIRDASDLSGVESTTFGTENFNNFRPTVAAGDNGGALAWYRYSQSPLRNQIVLQRFDEAINAAEETTVTMSSDGIPPYGPAISHVENDVYFVAWSEGDGGPTAKVNLRFVELAAP